MVTQWVPQQGDIVLVNFSPQRGREQRGQRPAVILSPAIYNRASGLALACPITSKKKGYPFEVELPPTLKTFGVVLVDSLRSIDWVERSARFVEPLPEATLQTIIRKLALLLRLTP